jgi:hypothetical protein
MPHSAELVKWTAELFSGMLVDVADDVLVVRPSRRRAA